MNCVVLLNGGKLFMEDCLISLKYNCDIIMFSFIVKSFRGILPAIVINEQTESIMNRCEIKGTSSKN